MNCPECQFEVPDDSKFCKECGCALTEEISAEKARRAVEGERKHVTILFSDLSGYTAMNEKLDPEEVKHLMGRIFSEAGRIVEKYGGAVERFFGDEIMALFGVPKAHEDDPVRAVKAALELNQKITEISPEYEDRIGKPLFMHTGINTGLVVTGDEYIGKGRHGLTGGTINLAKRLTGLAGEGEIVIGPDTQFQTAGLFTVEIKEKTTVKGKAEPVDVYKVLAPVDKPEKLHRLQGVRADLIGRDQEMETLSESIEQLKKGEGSVITIVGDAGTGKSRILREFRNNLEGGEVQWREGRAYGYTKNIPYYPLEDMLTFAFRIEEGDTPNRIRRKIESGLENLIGKDNSAFPYIGGLFSLQYQETADVSPEFWKEKLYDAIHHTLKALAQRGPSIVCFEDLHWSDPSTIEMLHRLIGDFSNSVLFLCTYRPTFDLFQDNELKYSTKNRKEIRLRDLDVSQSHQMLGSLLHSETIPEELVAFVQGKAEGNPFYLEEVVNSLIDCGVLSSNDGAWRLARPISEADIPPSIHGVLSARIDRLERHFKQILQEASVIGRAFLFKILETITRIETSIDQYLEGLENLDLIRMRSLEPDLEYIFKHALTQDVVYNGLLKKERTEIHEQIGQAIEKLFAERLPEFYEILAHHFSRGRSLDKAIKYHMLAGRKHLRKFALEEAHQSFQQAYDLLLKNLQEIPDGEGTLVRLLNQWSFVLYFHADYGGINRLVSKHEETAIALEDRSLTAMFLALLGWSYLGTEQYKIGENYLLKALEVAEEIQNQEILAYVYTWHSWTLLTLGAFENAIALGKKATELAETYDLEPYLHFKPMGAIAQTYWSMGDRLKGLAAGERLIALGESRGNIPALTMGYLMIGGSYLTDGDFHKAVEWLERVAGKQKDFIYYYASLALQGMAYLSLGEYDKAEYVLQKALDYLLVEDRFLWLATPANLFLGAVWIGQGRMNEGMQKIIEVRERLFKTGYKLFYVVSEYLLGNIFLQMALGEGNAGFTTIFKNIGFLIMHLPFAAKKAEHHLKRTANLADEIGAKGIKAQALLDLGRFYKAKNRKDESRRSLTQAIEMFTLCGVETFKRQAEDLLSHLDGYN